MGKHKHFKVKGFLIFSYEAEISMQFQNHGKSRFPYYEKSMGKHKHFKFMSFLNILFEAETHKIPNILEK